MCRVFFVDWRFRPETKVKHFDLTLEAVTRVPPSSSTLRLLSHQAFQIASSW